MKNARAHAVALALTLLSAVSSHAQRVASPGISAPRAVDPFEWLEEIQGKRALEWVSTHTAATLSALNAGSDYAALYADIRRALEVHDTISYPQIVGDRIYNLSHEAGHRRGIWRRTPWDQYVNNSARWENVLDLDSLAIADNVAWEFVGAECADSERQLCILELDHAGPGTPVFRAFEVDARKFVDLDPGLAPPRSASQLARSEMPNADVPNQQSRTDGDVYMVRDQVVVYLHEPWKIGAKTWAAGSIVATSLADFVGAKREMTPVFTPSARETIRSVDAARDYLVVSVLNNVRGEIRRYRYDRNRWVADIVDVPAMAGVDVISTSTSTNSFFFRYASFLQPTTLCLAQDDGTVRELRRMPATFDAANFVTEQREATSSDGTRIPFFIVRPREMRWDGSNPTLLYAYGGFELSSTPVYGTAVGPAWIARGGVYVVANVRGGGEFGPAWHDAGIKANRQRVYDDFIAVAEELIRLGVTSPAHLGIIGSSNGGLLAAVALTQRPDLFGAAVIQSALIDMRSYVRLGGARWIAEYGDPQNPGEWSYLARYSPYENIKSNITYPAVLFATNMLDDRVHPAHVRKMAAKMESMGAPAYYFENTQGSHGAGLTVDQKARTLALIYTFLWQNTKEPSASTPPPFFSGPED